MATMDNRIWNGMKSVKETSKLSRNLQEWKNNSTIWDSSYECYYVGTTAARIHSPTELKNKWNVYKERIFINFFILEECTKIYIIEHNN